MKISTYKIYVNCLIQGTLQKNQIQSHHNQGGQALSPMDPSVEWYVWTHPLDVFLWESWETMRKEKVSNQDFTYLFHSFTRVPHSALHDFGFFWAEWKNWSQSSFERTTGQRPLEFWTTMEKRENSEITRPGCLEENCEDIGIHSRSLPLHNETIKQARSVFSKFCPQQNGSCEQEPHCQLEWMEPHILGCNSALIVKKFLYGFTDSVVKVLFQLRWVTWSHLGAKKDKQAEKQ